MRTVLLPFCILLATLSFGQTEEFGRWKIGTVISFDKQHYGDFENLNGSNDLLCEAPTGLRTIDRTTGITAHYALTRKLDVGVGISHSKKRYMYDEFSPIHSSFFCSSLFYYPPTRFNHIEIPVFARYNFLKTKLNFHVESGATTGYIIDKDYYYQSRFSLSAQAGVGASYTIARQFNISVTGFYKRKLTNFDEKRIINNPNTTSIELRTIYIF